MRLSQTSFTGFPPLICDKIVSPRALNRRFFAMLSRLFHLLSSIVHSSMGLGMWEGASSSRATGLTFIIVIGPSKRMSGILSCMAAMCACMQISICQICELTEKIRLLARGGISIFLYNIKVCTL